LWGRCNPDSSNGIDKTVFNLSRTQAASGHAVAIFSIGDKPPIPVPGCEVRIYPPRHIPARLRTGLLGDLLLRRSPLNLPSALPGDLVSWNPTIVHFHGIQLPQAIRLARLLRGRGIPYCVSLHGELAVEVQRRHRVLKTLFAILAERAYLRNAAFIHAVSKADVDGLAAYRVENDVVFAPNCIDPSLMPRDLDGTFVTKHLPWVANKRLFIYMGRLALAQKGLDMLLRAWSRIPNRDRDALILVGPNWRDGRSRLQELVDALGIAESVAIIGVVSGRDKWALLTNADVFVHTSRWEGAPFAVLEAMVASRPLLITDRADPDGLVARAEAGVVVSADEEGIRAGLTRLIDADSAELMRLGMAARNLVVREFRWERTSSILLESYEQSSAKLDGDTRS
jgi:glycosyltransferase involved in cell wall biosynthesis